MNVPDPMPAIQKVAGVPPGVVKTVAQHDGVVISFVSDSNVKVNAAEVYELPPMEPLPVPEKVIVRGSALASAVSSNPVDSKLRVTQSSPGKLSLFFRAAVLLGGHAGTLDFAIIVSRRPQTSAPAFNTAVRCLTTSPLMEFAVKNAWLRQLRVPAGNIVEALEILDGERLALLVYQSRDELISSNSNGGIVTVPICHRISER